MRQVAWLLILAACEFSPPLASFGDANEGEPDAGTDAAASAAVPCMTPDATGLVLCLELEDGVDDGLLRDSSPGKHDAATIGLVPATRVTSNAAMVGAEAETRIAEDAPFDLDAAYTATVWVQPQTLPASGEAQGVFDREGQYAMVIGRSTFGGHQNRCAHTDVGFEYTSGLPTDRWTFLACTWDGVQLCAVRWSGPTDRQRYCSGIGAPKATGSRGLAIGHLSDQGAPVMRFTGALDSLQIYRRALSEDQLCAMVGEPAGCL
ncbi:MAG TPA: LamG-like jellyroll fold domain-containing protein [Kofleriaceae bacterium]